MLSVTGLCTKDNLYNLENGFIVDEQGGPFAHYKLASMCAVIATHTFYNRVQGAAARCCWYLTKLRELLHEPVWITMAAPPPFDGGRSSHFRLVTLRSTRILVAALLWLSLLTFLLGGISFLSVSVSHSKISCRGNTVIYCIRLWVCV